MTPAYAKLHILLAREARVGLVIRHGTAKSVCTLLWDRKRDRFTLGQWMRGRIDLETCDLSPDGTHFLYSASKYVNRSFTLDGWTAVSRTPYLKALDFYRHRWGGWFLGNREYCSPGAPSPDDRVSPDLRRVEPMGKLEVPLYTSRMQRNGWKIDEAALQTSGLEFVLPAGAGWELRHLARGGYRLGNAEQKIDTRGWNWAGMDSHRLVWTVKGCLWTGSMRKAGLHEPRMVHDFNGMQFEAIAAPYAGGQPVPPEGEPAQVRAPAEKPRARPRQPVRKKPDRSRVRPEDDV